ncbi:hypothetical protein DAEQUDRAFT_304766 [Daedalea quercina L-15889]|uniref:Uncharacterized protein n=1 Tax=Daedalea quercina L-15889 TaxID=1314783 RepID=A0A165Q147_9APHY|nr:hypothetical protein DAEQUDRAFT_304766 [Daedalea quercina L-15889]
MHLLRAIVGGLRALSDLAHAYCPAGDGKALSVHGTGGLCSGITGTMDKVVFKVEDSLSGFDNTTSGILGYSVIGHEWVSDVRGFFGGISVFIGAHESSNNIAFVNDTSPDGYTVLGFTDLVIHMVLNDLNGTGVYEQPATTTDIIVAPKYELILWKDAQMCTIPARWLTTKDLIVAPAFELAIWVPPNTCLLCERPRPKPFLLGRAPAQVWWNTDTRKAAVTRLLRLKGTLGIRAVGLITRVISLALGYGIYLLVVGAMLWSALTTSWYNTGIGYGVSLAVLGIANVGLSFILPLLAAIHEGQTLSQASTASAATSHSDRPSALSEEAFERELAELARTLTRHDANINMLQSGIARLDPRDAALGQVVDSLANADSIVDDILALTQAGVDVDDLTTIDSSQSIVTVAAQHEPPVSQPPEDPALASDEEDLSDEEYKRLMVEVLATMQRNEENMDRLESRIAQHNENMDRLASRIAEPDDHDATLAQTEDDVVVAKAPEPEHVPVPALPEYVPTVPEHVPTVPEHPPTDSEDLAELSDEELEREIAELKRAIEAYDRNMNSLEAGMARLDAHDATLEQVGDRLAVAEGVAGGLLARPPIDFEGADLHEGKGGEVVEAESTMGLGAPVGGS